MLRVIPHQLLQLNRSPTHCDHLLNSRDYVHLKPKTLCKHLIELKLFCLLKIFPEVAQNSLRIP